MLQRHHVFGAQALWVICLLVPSSQCCDAVYSSTGNCRSSNIMVRCGCDRPRPNGLRVSCRLEGTTVIDREGFLAPLDAKIAPIQPVSYTRLLGRPVAFAHGRVDPSAFIGGRCLFGATSRG